MGSIFLYFPGSQANELLFSTGKLRPSLGCLARFRPSCMQPDPRCETWIIFLARKVRKLDESLLPVLAFWFAMPRCMAS